MRYFTIFCVAILIVSCGQVERRQEDTIVYVTMTGKKYHRKGCEYLRYSAKAIKIDMVGEEYQPCLVCKPMRP